MGEPVSLWIHGHVHNSNDYDVNGTRIILTQEATSRRGLLKTPSLILSWL